MVANMTTHRTLLAQLMSERNLSQEDVAKRFQLAAQELERRTVSISLRQLSRWISGEGGMPRPVGRRILEFMFGYPAEQLLAPPNVAAESTGAPARLVISRGSRDAGATASMPSHQDVGLLRAAASRARDFGLVVGSMSMSPELPDQLYADLQRLGSVYPRVALSDILSDIVSTQEAIYQLLESQRSPNQARQLYFLAAVAGGMLAKASHDLAEPHAALTHARAAFLCAEHADHHGLMSWTRSLQALIAYWAGRPAESARYAAHARELATSGVGGASLWAYLSEARALAASGNREAARELIVQADHKRGSVVSDELDEIGGLFSFGPIRQLYYAGEALSWNAKDAVEAAGYSARAAEGYGDQGSPEWAFGDQAGAHANLAISRLNLGEAAGAREAISPLLRLPHSRRMNGIVLSAQRVGRVLAQSPGGRDHAELRDEIESFCRLPSSALPR